MLELVVGYTLCLILGWFLRGWLDAEDIEAERNRLIISANAWKDLINTYRKNLKELANEWRNMREDIKSMSEKKELIATIKELEERKKELEKQIKNMQSLLN